MSMTFSVTDHWEDTKRVHVCGKIALSGNYPTGGDTINFGALSTDSVGVSIKSGSVPSYLSLTTGLIGSGSGFNINWVPGTTVNNQKAQIIQDSTGNELAAAAYPTALITAGLNFYAIFPKHI